MGCREGQPVADACRSHIYLFRKEKNGSDGGGCVEGESIRPCQPVKGEGEGESESEGERSACG